jgi:hypothetical protein
MDRWYLSFAGDTGFLGCTVVEGLNPKSAIENATRQGLNPGGEVAIFIVPKVEWNSPDMMAAFNHLLSLDEIKKFGGKQLKDMNVQETQAFEAMAHIGCSCCNEGARKKAQN